MRLIFFIISLLYFLLAGTIGHGQEQGTVLFKDVKIFDGTSSSLSAESNVLIKGNTIQKISQNKISVDENTLIIEGNGKTLMPGMIDAHVHMAFGSMTMTEMMWAGLSEEFVMSRVSEQAEQMLMRGFTAVRDAGGPIFPIKAAIDKGKMKGPRIWPSGATISQTSGHGDFRTPDERSRRFFGKPSRAEEFGATFIADGRDEVLAATRENLRFGASQIKLMAGGGTSSAYDPIDVTQYTFDEMRAAVEAAEDWGTYVTVHAYTPRAVQRAIDAGVKCIDHGQLLDRRSLRKIKRNNIWLSMQVLVESTPDMDPARLEKRRPIIENQPKVWEMAKRMGVKVAWGTDFLFEPDLMELQNEYLLKVNQWYSPAEVLKIATHDNAQLLALSGLRSPYQGKLGVVKEGALADLLLVDGNPIEDLSIIAQPKEKFVIIMKDGVIYKNILED
ncbi:MAG: amidohydrolase family protein [Saprospirales bacterium]|nr:MAG: amidohydrolase family protein [Saprospirales bacterium]